MSLINTEQQQTQFVRLFAFTHTQKQPQKKDCAKRAIHENQIAEMDIFCNANVAVSFSSSFYLDFVSSSFAHFYFDFVCVIPSDIFANYRLPATVGLCAMAYLSVGWHNHYDRILLFLFVQQMNSIMVFTDYSAFLSFSFIRWIFVNTPFDMLLLVAFIVDIVCWCWLVCVCVHNLHTGNKEFLLQTGFWGNAGRHIDGHQY